MWTSWDGTRNSGACTAMIPRCSNAHVFQLTQATVPSKITFLNWTTPRAIDQPAKGSGSNTEPTHIAGATTGTALESTDCHDSAFDLDFKVRRKALHSNVCTTARRKRHFRHNCFEHRHPLPAPCHEHVCCAHRWPQSSSTR